MAAPPWPTRRPRPRRPVDPARRRRRARGSRGAAALEAALVTPLVLLLCFGTIEMALLIKDNLALSSAVRNGGRIASANANAGPGGSSEAGDCTAPCDGNNTPLLARRAADAVASAGTALPRSAIQELWVFKANAAGYPGTQTSFASCSTDCVRYQWVAARGQFRYIGGTWTSSTIRACLNSSDSVGLYMTARHDWNTGLFGGTVTIADNATFQFEPLEIGACEPGKHP